MLQQTQVAAVVPYYRRFVARFPTLEALAAAPDEDVFALWSGLGYYARCRNLLAAARTALARHGGLPASLEELRALPGFGPYTAGAVAAIAFVVPAPAVDGNVARVLSRLFLVDGDPSAAATRERLWALARELVDPERPGDLLQAWMELGATVCVKPAPRCERCPLAPPCAAHACGREREVPVPRRRPEQKPLSLACALVERGDAVLAVRRPEGGLFADQWAPPAVEVAPGEAPRAREVERALRRDHGLEVAVGDEVAYAERVLTHRRLALRGFQTRLLAEPRGAVAWISLSALEGQGVPTAFRALLASFSSHGTELHGRRRPAEQGPRRGGRASSARDHDSA
jgi:A/G-specific adenine glycosylase